MHNHLRRWWTKKYRLPPTSDEFGRYTYEELLLEYFEDLYENDKDVFEAFKTPGEIDESVETGDPVTDELVRRLDAGEDLGVEDLEVLERGSGEQPDPQEEGVEDADWEDDYSDLSAPEH